MAWNESQLVDALIVALVQNSPFGSLAGAPMPSELEDQMEAAMERIADPIYNFVESWAIEPGVLELSYQFKTDLDDPLPGYLEAKIDDVTLQINEDTRRLFVASTNIATDEVTGGIRIGSQPYLYMSGPNLMLNAEISSTLVGGNNMVPTSRAVKVYVDTAIQGLVGSGGVGDMLKSTYDTDNDGVVDDSEMLGTQLPAYYLNWNNFTNTPITIAGYGITDAYTETEIDAFFEGESLGKKQVDWARIINRDTVVSVSGTGVNNQLAVFQSGNVIEGDSNLTWDGNNLLLATGKGIMWGDGDTLIWQVSDDWLYFSTNNNTKFYISPTEVVFNCVVRPNVSKDIDFGHTSYYWKNGYFEQLILNSPSNNITSSGNDMVFTDPNAGTKTLAELASNNLSILYEKLTIPAGQTGYFYVGNTSENWGLQLRYMVRVASTYESGYIYIVNRAGVVSMDRSSFGENPQVGMSVTTEGTNIRLDVTAPSSGPAYFGYTKIYGDKYDGPNYWEGLNAPRNSVTLTPATTTKFCVGNQYHGSIKIQYGIIRGNQTQIGELTILVKSGTTEINLGSIGGDVGCTLNAEYNTIDVLGYVYLTAQLNYGDGNTATMFYDVIYDDYDRTWDRDTRSFKRFAWVSNNHTNRYIIGNKHDHIGFEIYYEMRRGTQIQTGKIFISDNGTSDPDKSFTFYGDSCGVIFDAELDGYGNFKMIFKTDNMGVTGELEYMVLPIKRPFNWDNIISQIGGKNINNIIKNPTGTQDTYVISWDNTNNEYTLTAVESGGDYWQRVSTTISPITTGDNVDIGTGELLIGNRILFSEVSAPSPPASDKGYLYMDSSDEKLYFKTSTQTYDLTQSSATSYWQRVGTDLKPVTAGDDILLAQGTESIKWGDGDTSLYEVTANTLRIITNGVIRMDWDDNGIIRVYGNILPNSTGVYDIGNISLRFRYQYISGYIDFAEMATPGTPAVNTGYVYMDSADEKLYFKTSSSTYDLTAGATSSPWILDGTNIKPATGGNDILLSSGETLQFGTTGTDWIITFPNAQTTNTGIRWVHGDTSLSFLNNNVENIRMELDTGYIKLSGTQGLFQGKTIYVNTIRSNVQNGILLWAQSGDVAFPDGKNITLIAGDAYTTGNNYGGHIYLVPGLNNGTGAEGSVYLGSDSYSKDTLHIRAKGSLTHVGLIIDAQAGQSLWLGETHADLASMRVQSQSGSTYITTSIGGNDVLLKAGTGGAASVSGPDLILQGGVAGSVGDNDGGDIFIQGGAPNGTGIRGNIFIGTGAAGYLPEDNNASNIINYDTSTGKLTYREFSLKIAEVTLTQSQIQNLYSSPVTVISSPGADHYIEVISASAFYNYDTSGFSGGTYIRLKYHGNSIYPLRTSTNFLVWNEDRFEVMYPDTTSNIVVLNNNTLLVMADADSTGGSASSTIKVMVLYRILSSS